MSGEVKNRIGGVEYKLNVDDVKVKQNQVGANFADFNYAGKEQIEKELNEVVENKSVKDEVETDSGDTSKVNNIQNDKYQSISLPSGFIFYDFKDLKARKFEVRDLAKMSKVMKTESHKLFKEVIQNCIDRDVDSLTPGDFKYLCYWLRLNSYPNSPMSINWKSKYGNDNVSVINKSSIIKLAPDIKEDEYRKWENEGFVVPTMKFSAIFSQDDLSEDDDFLYSNAQYFKGNIWDEKLKTMEDFLEKNGLEALNKITEFDKLVDHGVQEEVTVTDLKFHAPDYKNTLEQRIKKLKEVISSPVLDYDSDEAALLNLNLASLEEEYSELCKKMDSGEEVPAEPETIFLEVDAAEFLSPVLSAIH